jgi:hypothetical protein
MARLCRVNCAADSGERPSQDGPSLKWELTDGLFIDAS